MGGWLLSILLPCHAQVYSFPISDNRYSFHFFSMAVSSYTQRPCLLACWLVTKVTIVISATTPSTIWSFKDPCNFFSTWSSIMRVVKGYRIIDIPVGIGSVLHPLYIKEHNNPQGHHSSELTVGRKLDSHIPDNCICMPWQEPTRIGLCSLATSITRRTEHMKK